MIVALLATASGVLIYCTYHAWRLWSAVLDKESYEDDIRFLGPLFSKIRRSRHLLVEYYSKTTDRDYRILEWFVGPGMHTRLECCPSQVDLVARHVNDSRSVLEVGSGRGYCTNSLAASMPRVNFHGVDLVERHVQISRENAAENSSFFCVDVAVHRSDAQYDMIFGVESLCHVGDLSFVKTLLRPGGKLVIIDGFRRNGAKVATEMVEAGFRIMNRFLTKEEWIEEAEYYNLRLTDDVDLTEHTAAFWTLGWRYARVVARFLPLSVVPLHSAANLLAVCAVAHAMERREVEYGVLVFVKNPVAQ